MDNPLTDEKFINNEDSYVLLELPINVSFWKIIPFRVLGTKNSAVFSHLAVLNGLAQNIGPYNLFVRKEATLAPKEGTESIELTESMVLAKPDKMLIKKIIQQKAYADIKTNNGKKVKMELIKRMMEHLKKTEFKLDWKTKKQTPYIKQYVNAEICFNG